MYIDPFLAGILVTIFSEVLVIFIYAIYKGRRK